MARLRCRIPRAESPSWTSPATVSSCGAGRPVKARPPSRGMVTAHVRTAEDAAQNPVSEVEVEDAPAST